MKELEKKNKIPGLSGMYLWSDPLGGHSFCIYVKDEERNSPEKPDVYSDDALEFDKARNHHHEVGHHRTGLEERVQCTNEGDNLCRNRVLGDAPIDNTSIGGSGFRTPGPCILKRSRLSPSTPVQLSV